MIKKSWKYSFCLLPSILNLLMIFVISSKGNLVHSYTTNIPTTINLCIIIIIIISIIVNLFCNEESILTASIIAITAGTGLSLVLFLLHIIYFVFIMLGGPMPVPN